MHRTLRAVVRAACVLVLTGCSAPAVPLLPPQPVDGTAFTGPIEVTTASVAKVSGTTCSGGTLIGSAFVAGDHLVLTAAHVVADARTIELAFPGHARLVAQLIEADADDDTALLRVSDDVPPALGFAGTPVAIGDPVAIVGFPLADQVAHSGLARVSARDEPAVLEGHQLRDLLVVDAQVPAGSSGGPIIDVAGGVQGMVSAQIAGRGGRDSSAVVMLAIPASRLAGRLPAWGGLPARVPCR